MQKWRKNILENHLVPALVILDFVLCVIFLLIAYSTGSLYFKGVGIGLAIAWVTGAIAYFIKRMVK